MGNEQMDEVIVIGGSIAGLTAAAALSGYFNQVAIVEHDKLPEGPEQRAGVPQGHHVHAIQGLGIGAFEEMFPGFCNDLVAAGAVPSDLVRDGVWWDGSSWRPRADSRCKMYNQSRPLFESVVRKRVLEIDNIDVVTASVVGITATDDAGRITGVKVRDETGERDIAADFVLDASGRGSRSLKWLAELGYDRPRQVEVHGFLTYTSRYYRVPAGVIPEGVSLVISPCFPGHNQGACLVRQEEDIWILSAQGMINEAAPTDDEGFLAFLEKCSTPYLYELAKQCEPASEIKTYRAPRNLRRFFEDLDRRPRGFGLIGDAVAHFNPVYGQGMSVAVLSAQALQAALADGIQLDELPEAIQEAITPAVEWAFNTAATSDARYSGAEIKGDFELPPEETLELFGKLEQMAAEDPEVLVMMMNAFYANEPETLFAPAVKERVEQWVGSGGSTPTFTDPLSPPTVIEGAVV
jgi:2-polyprenyl-6-methoxyphenol hydroxylase-like FAD-dependent oxidoreductase